MSTKSSNKDLNKIRSDFDKLFAFDNQEEKIEADAKLLMAKFLSKIQEVTDEKDIKRKELAEMIGTSASYLTQLFRGHKIINLMTLAKLEDALNLEFDIKLKGEGVQVSDIKEKDIAPLLNKWHRDDPSRSYLKLIKNVLNTGDKPSEELSYDFTPDSETQNKAS